LPRSSEDIPGRTYVLNNERTSKRSPRTTLAPFGSSERAVVTRYIRTFDIVRLVAPRPANGRNIGGAVISIAGIVSIRLAELDIAMSAFSRCPGMLCIQTGEIRNISEGQRNLTGALDDEANRHRGNTSAIVIATLAAINALKERRRGRFVTAGGSEPLRAAYRGRVHDDEKINAMEAIGTVKKNELLPAHVQST
jgi:hypothetical protein